MKIFINHAPEDKETADRLYDDLKNAGFSPWMESRNLLAGQNQKETVPKMIRESSSFLTLFSSKSLTQSGSFRKNLKAALEILDENPSDKIFLIPVRIDECKIPNEELRDIQAVDLFPSYEDGFNRLRLSLSEPEIESYKKNAAALYEKIRLAGFKTKVRIPIRLEDIYVPLRAMMDRRGLDNACYADAEEAEERLREHNCGMEISLAEAFRESEGRKRRGLVILGDPGSGKTTHMKRVLLWCLSEHADKGPESLGLPKDMIPVFLPLRELRDVKQGLHDFIQQQLDDPNLLTPKGFGERLRRRGKLLLLLDGLDEVMDTGHRQAVSRWIEKLHDVLPDCRFIVTCRFAGYTEEARLNEDFLEMHIRPLSAEQAEAFIHNWYRTVVRDQFDNPKQAEIEANRQADDLCARLREPEFRALKVFSMTRNPLLLTNICLVHYDRGILPKNRARLYDECTEVLLERWRQAKKVQIKVTAESGKRVLQPAALWMHRETGRMRAKAEDLAPIIDPVIKAVKWPHGSAREFLRTVRDESGLLTGWDQEHYGFMHLGFQEYLTALEIRGKFFSDPSILKELAAKFGQSWWREVILLLLAVEGRMFEPFMRHVVNLSAFAKYPDLVDACLEDSGEVSLFPFSDLLQTDPGTSEEFWKQQMAALRVLERVNAESVEELIPILKNHPYAEIQKRIRALLKEEKQDVIFTPKGNVELVRIPAGTFLMGSPENEKGRSKTEGPQHEVQVPEFYMGRYPVTNEEYGRFMTDTGAKEPGYWGESNWNGPKQPVVGVSWYDAQKFAEWIGGRLPSEAEWEYACRAGTTTRFYNGDTEKDLDRAAWYRKNSGDKTHPVGEKEPNSFGIYDILGNVWEWCEDDWYENYENAPADGSAWKNNPRKDRRVLRGGSLLDSSVDVRCAARDRNLPDYWNFYWGFRLCVRSRLEL